MTTPIPLPHDDLDDMSRRALVVAAIRRAAAQLRWRSPEGEEKRALGVQNGDTPVISAGHLTGFYVGREGHFIAWSDGTRTPAREVADPRLGWKAILEVEER